MAFEGYYLKFGNQPLLADILVAESYQCVPGQKIIIDSFVDVDRKEHRDISKNTKTTVSVTTKDYLTSEQKGRLLSVLRQGLVNEIEGRYQVTYWNPNTDNYGMMEAFLTDIEYTVLMELDSGPVYSAVTLELEQDRG